MNELGGSFFTTGKGGSVAKGPGAPVLCTGGCIQVVPLDRKPVSILSM